MSQQVLSRQVAPRVSNAWTAEHGAEIRCDRQTQTNSSPKLDRHLAEAATDAGAEEPAAGASGRAEQVQPAKSAGSRKDGQPSKQKRRLRRLHEVRIPDV